MNNIFEAKRILGIDFGLKRVGLAVCDELHISITTLQILKYNTEKFWDDLLKIISDENASAVVVGMPERLDNKKTDVILKIEEFVDTLKEKISIPVYEFDESFTTKRAVETMLLTGKRKKQRAKKGAKDSIAAAILLRDFLSSA